MTKLQKKIIQLENRRLILEERYLFYKKMYIKTLIRQFIIPPGHLRDGIIRLAAAWISKIEEVYNQEKRILKDWRNLSMKELKWM